MPLGVPPNEMDHFKLVLGFPGIDLDSKHFDARYCTPMGTTLYGSVGAHGSTTDYWAAVGVTEQKAARSCLRLMSPCEESVHERAGILVHLTAIKNYWGQSPPRHKRVY